MDGFPHLSLARDHGRRSGDLYFPFKGARLLHVPYAQRVAAGGNLRHFEAAIFGGDREDAEFFGLYFSMTGLHGLHVLVGAIVLLIVGIKLLKKPYETVEFDERRLEGLRGARLSLTDESGGSLWSSDAVDASTRSIEIQFKYLPVAKRIRKQDYAALENSGLYWHLVDLIWIFLFPVFYLIT